MDSNTSCYKKATSIISSHHPSLDHFSPEMQFCRKNWTSFPSGYRIYFFQTGKIPVVTLLYDNIPFLLRRLLKVWLIVMAMLNVKICTFIMLYSHRWTTWMYTFSLKLSWNACVIYFCFCWGLENKRLYEDSLCTVNSHDYGFLLKYKDFDRFFKLL